MTKPPHFPAPPLGVNIEDLRILARRRLPRAVFDYLDGGAEIETSLRVNVRALESWTVRPRNAIAHLMDGTYLGMIPYLAQLCTRRGCVAQYLMDGGLQKLPNVVIPGVGQMALVGVAAALADSVVTWQDFHWLREVWPGPIIAK